MSFLTLSLSMGEDVSCSKRTNLLSTIWLGSVISCELYISNKVYNDANGL